MDRAGRLVIPKELRERIGLRPGEVDIHVDGAGLRVDPVAGDSLVERRGHLVVPTGGQPLDDDEVRELRHADQR